MQLIPNDFFDLDGSTGVLYWKKPSKYHKDLLGAVAGCPRSNRGSKVYWVIKWNGKTYRRSQLVFWIVNGRRAEPIVDHINSNSLDDRPTNLREASYLLNARNHIRRNIRYVEKTGRYQVRLGKLQVGSFDSEDIAIKAYDAERARIWQT